MTATSRPLLNAEQTRTLWNPRARLAQAVAATRCCADPALLVEIARRDRRGAVGEAVIANPSAPVVALWHVAAAATSTPGVDSLARRATRAAVQRLHVEFDTVLAAARDIDVDAGLVSAVRATLTKYITDELPTEPAARALLGLPERHSSYAADLLAKQVFDADADERSVGLRAALWDTHQEIMVNRALLVLATTPTGWELAGELIGELRRNAPHSTLSVRDAVRLFEQHQIPEAAALLDEATDQTDLSACGPYVTRHLIDISGHPAAPAGLAARLPATPLTVARCLAETGATTEQWRTALTLLPDDRTTSGRDTVTAGDIVAQAAVTV